MQHRTSEAAPWLNWLLVLIGLVLAVLLGAVAVRNNDIWLHLATGRTIAQGKYQFGVDPFSFASENRPWINHAWLFDLGLYGVLKSAGGIGVALVRVAITVGLFLIWLSIRKPGASLAIPAIGGAIALVAANSRLPLLQPMVVSYFMLGLLVALLHRGGQRLPPFVGVLCAIWANLDGWFVLGPITIALWLIGSLMRREERTPPKLLAITLIAAMIGGLLTPHHIHAYTWPDDIVPTFFPAELRSDPALAPYLEGSFGSRHLAPAPTFALFALLGLGVLSFIVNAAETSAIRFIVWSAFATLAIWRWRFAPFFAVAGTPLMVLNFQEWLLRLQGGALGRHIGLALRALAVGGLALLAFAAWPGWLGPRPDEPQRAARFNPTLLPDQALERLSRQVNDAIVAGKLDAGVRVFSPSVDVTPYLAWNAPQAKGFLDLRWRLFAPVAAEFLEIRKAVMALGEPLKQGDTPPDPKAIEPFLQKHGISTLMLTGTDRGERVGPARVLWANPDRWAFRGLAGCATMFGYLNPPSQDPQPTLRVDPFRLAFGPKAVPAPGTVSTDEPKIPTFWDSYFKGPPAPPIEFSEGQAWLEFTSVAQAETESQRFVDAIWRPLAFHATRSIPLTPLPFLDLPTLGLTPAQVFKRPDLALGSWAGPIVSVRSLRMAQGHAPDDPAIRIRLAELYRLRPVDHGLTQIQRIAALQQTKFRLEVASGWGYDVGPMRLIVADHMAQYFLETNQLDLYLDAAREARDLLPRYGPELLGAAVADEYERRTQLLEQRGKQIAAILNDFELAAEHDSTAMRIQRALERGLPGQALKAMENVLPQNQVGPGLDPIIMLEALLQVGRAEDARSIIHSRYFPLSTVPVHLRGRFRNLLLQAALACGDYQEAMLMAAELSDESTLTQDRATGIAAAGVATLAVAIDPLAAPGLARVTGMPLWFGVMHTPRMVAIEVWTNRIRQGLIALEAGDTVLAKATLEKALRNPPLGLRFTNQAEREHFRAFQERAERYFNLLRHAEQN